jgi:hypothetical protein
MAKALDALGALKLLRRQGLVSRQLARQFKAEIRSESNRPLPASLDQVCVLVFLTAVQPPTPSLH